MTSVGANGWSVLMGKCAQLKGVKCIQSSPDIFLRVVSSSSFTEKENVSGAQKIYFLLCNKKSRFDFADELKVGDARYKHLT